MCACVYGNICVNFGALNAKELSWGFIFLVLQSGSP